MRASEVYRRAAEKVSDEPPAYGRSCSAVGWVELTIIGRVSTPLRARYTAFMLGGNEKTHELFGDDSNTEAGKHISVLLLLLMSAIAAEEEKGK